MRSRFTSAVVARESRGDFFLLTEERLTCGLVLGFQKSIPLVGGLNLEFRDCSIKITLMGYVGCRGRTGVELTRRQTALLEVTLGNCRAWIQQG